MRRATRTAMISLAIMGSIATAAAQQPQSIAERRCSAEAATGRGTPCALYLEYATADSATSSDRSWAWDRYQRARRIVDERGSDPMAWYVLGLTNLIASQAGVVAREGPLQPPGTTHEAGAGRAFIRALELDTSFVDAADALAMVPRPREGKPELARWLAVLREYRGRMAAFPGIGAARFAREVGAIDEARQWLDAAEATGGVPHGIIAVDRSRVLALAGLADSVEAVYFEGARDTTAEAQQAYREAVSMVGSADDVASWDSTAISDRSAWLRAFWLRRDVEQAWPAGSRLMEHYRRLELAWDRYRLILPHTGRHQLSQMSRNFDYFAEELLDRYYTEYFAQYDDLTNTRLAADRQLFGNNALYRAFKGSIPVLDDRGLIFIRHGEPDKTAKTTGGAALELWLYDLPDGPMLLSFKEEDFDGQIGASVLVPTLMGMSPLLRQQICHLDTRLCPMNNDPSSTSLAMTGEGLDGNFIRSGQPQRQLAEVQRLSGGGALARAQADGEAAMAKSTSTDGYRRRFDKQLETRAVFHGLVRRDAGPVLVVPFAIPGDKLDGIPIGADGRTGYRVRFLVQAVRSSDGMLQTIDTVRGLATPRRLGAGEYLSGVMELPVEPGVYTASLLTSQEGSGSVSSISRVAVPAGSGRAMSDLVLGREGSGASWNSGSQVVPTNPLGGWKRDEDVEVYLQLLGVPAGEQFRMRFEFWSVDRERRDAEVSVGFDESSSGVRHEVRRSLRLHDLDPGRWRLKVVVTTGAGELATEGRITVVR